MKTLALLLLIALKTICCFSRQDSIPKRLSPNSPGKPLSDYSFNRYLIDAYSFALLGSQTPTTGIKFETIKPKVVLSGNLHISPSKRHIFSIELSGGIRENIMDLFSKDKTSGQFSASATYHMLIWRNSAGYDSTKLTPQERRFRNWERDAIQMDADQTARESILQLVLLDQEFLKSPDISTLESLYTKMKKTPAGSFTASLYKKTILGILIQYGTTDTDLGEALKNFASRFASTKPVRTIGLDTNYISPRQARLLKKNYVLAKERLESIRKTASDLEIEAFRSEYTYNGLRWLSFTPQSMHTSYQEYAPPVLPATEGTLISRNLWESKLRIAFNYLRKFPTPNKFYYFSGGITPTYSGSLADMKAFSYKKTEQYKVGTESITAEETGTAYIGYSDRKFGYEVFLETYLVPFNKRFVPGLYFKASVNHNKAWTNSTQVPVEIGMVFNLPSSTKEAINQLSVIPYCAWTNIRNSKDVVALTPLALHEKFSIGVKVGVPINIGK